MTILSWSEKQGHRKFLMIPVAAALACGTVLGGCPSTVEPSGSTSGAVDSGPPDSGVPDVQVKPDVMVPSGEFCKLPGAVVFDAAGQHVVPGGGAHPDLTWLTLPPGFCAHYFANVPNTRQLRFAPGGELFVASP